MSLASLLEAWPAARGSAAAWRAILAGDEAGVVRATAEAIASPQLLPSVFAQLVAEGDFDIARLLLEDEQFACAVGPEDVVRMDAQLEAAARAEAERVGLLVGSIAARGAAIGVDVDVRAVLTAATRSRRLASDLASAAGDAVSNAEGAEVERQRQRLMAVQRPAAMNEPTFERWRHEVEGSLAVGALEAARAALDTGPDADAPPVLDIPTPPIWPYRDERWTRILGWFFHEGSIPPGFDRYRPQKADRDGWSVLTKLRAWPQEDDEERREDLLRAVAGILGADVSGVDEYQRGTVLRVQDLPAPGLHAFSSRFFKNGIPIWLSCDDSDAPAPLSGTIVRLTGGGARSGAHELLLSIHDVLALIGDSSGRRDRLVAQLSRQLPLEEVFRAMVAEDAVAWRRQDLPPALQSPPRPVLLVGAPGMGKTTLLDELSVAGARTVDARVFAEAPDARIFLVDNLSALDDTALRSFTREVHWRHTASTPAPVIVAAGRPEVVGRIERAAPALFDVMHLPPRSIAALKRQARVMLGWAGIEATDSGVYDALAYRASGNPSLLFHLCASLVRELVADGGRARRFDADVLERAWQSGAFRREARALLWDPLSAIDGAADVVRAVVTFASPGKPLAVDELVWAVGEVLGEKTVEWTEERARILCAYGLLAAADGGFQLGRGGVSQLVRDWCA